ncbi:MAG TPA: hypothetical protein VGF77_08665 [Allosphingosinicella sp.]
MSTSSEIAAAYNALLEDIEPLLFIVRDSGLQRAGIEALEAFVSRADQARIRAILEANEEHANLFLGFRSAARSLVNEMKMYLLLKQDDPEGAWSALIDAQELLGAASRAHQGFDYLGPKANHLRDLEKWIFPPQVFVSAGMIVREQRCSICDDDYERCDHIAGRPYLGRFCTIILKQASLDHVAIVDDPADRRCRVTTFKVPGGTRNRMTWVITPDDENESDSRSMKMIIATAGSASVDLRPAAETTIDQPRY